MASYWIYRRKDKYGAPTGNWLARAYLGNYREEYASLKTKDRHEAEIRAARWYASLLQWASGPDPKGIVTLGEAIDAYKMTDRYLDLAEGTRLLYDRYWGHMRDWFGDERPIAEIGDDDLRRWKAELLSKYSSNTVRTVLGAPISRIFKYALAKGWIARDPFSLVSVPSLERTPFHERESFTDQQMDTLLEHAPDAQYRRLWAIYRWTGCRRTEGLRVRRQHVHRDEGYIYIDGTKNSRAKRVMPIFPQLQDYLSRLPRRTTLFNDSHDTAQNVLTKVGKEAGISPAYPTMFRRAFISKMRRQTKIPPPVWQRWVGHGSEGVARDHYEAQDLEFERGLIETL